MNFNVKEMEKESKKELEKLQRNRSKANKSKKAYWQKRIDDFFLGR